MLAEEAIEMAGKLYGISTGPGDPELLTLKAVRILSECGVIAAPRKPEGSSLALQIAGAAVDLSEKRMMLLDFPMTRNRAVLTENFDRIASQLCDVLQHADIAMLCLGDISLYATFPEIGKRVAAKGFEVETVSGVPSFCAAASRAGLPLVSADEPFQVLPYGCPDFAERLSLSGAKIILKCGSHMPELRVLLQKLGLLERSYAVENCGLENECLYPELPEKACGYFTVVCILPERLDV